jgi:hypothetical protein
MTLFTKGRRTVDRVEIIGRKIDVGLIEGLT